MVIKLVTAFAKCFAVVQDKFSSRLFTNIEAWLILCQLNQLLNEVLRRPIQKHLKGHQPNGLIELDLSQTLRECVERSLVWPNAECPGQFNPLRIGGSILKQVDDGVCCRSVGGKLVGST